MLTLKITLRDGVEEKVEHFSFAEGCHVVNVDRK